jgi:hypothetical protein
MTSKGGDFDYDTHGGGYAQRRRPDPRIETMVHAALGEAKTVLNVGAGAGSYEPLDRRVIAIEPSAAMRAQRLPDRPAIIGFAEQLPLDDQSVDAAMAMYTVHQWADLDAGLAELRRVTRGPVVIMAGDAEAFDRLWVTDYCPELLSAEAKRTPSMSYIAERIGARSEVLTVPIPFDCADGFLEAFYGRPEKLLEPEVRKAQSSWGFIADGVEARFVETLSKDLASGRWDERYGHLRTQLAFEGALRLIVGWPK